MADGRWQPLCRDLSRAEARRTNRASADDPRALALDSLSERGRALLATAASQVAAA